MNWLYIFDRLSWLTGVLLFLRLYVFKDSMTLAVVIPAFVLGTFVTCVLSGQVLFSVCWLVFLGIWSYLMWRELPIGTKSLLLGAHAFWLHPWFVAAAWWKLYGFPADPRLWVAFVVHDWGYWGKPNMDGPEGLTHPELGANIMHALFDGCGPVFGLRSHRWRLFTLFHSRHYAKAMGFTYSKLCVADKLAIALVPAWVYLPMTRLTGELTEYMQQGKRAASSQEALSDAERELVASESADAWYVGVRAYCVRWALEHRDCKEDTWTPDLRIELEK